ncbi:uncharacterized protein BDZ99DRAFT_168467 [Mytilinidion resinicola]|uniref:Zn(2)-C6 fungal-type domain-containing protein n=1 Tax=Mytilinidion resinicola TaxID=574789 RepID=A0A6A6Y482_9PEZI|nr:uncharacterized protein BDZ99DRAFT_168467 [Mytilinidion resinicola]KAF2803651.1 hypothetical protein BDZ99DRAFT_168467 [Mytilinidion resinicola]
MRSKPVCTRCQNSGFPCEGYPKDLTFVDEGSRFASQSSTRSSKAGSRTGEVSSVDAPSLSPKGSQTPNVQLAISKQPTLSPFQDEICLAYLIRTLFGDNHNFPLASHVWDSAVASTDSAKLGQTAVSSLATTYFGRMHGSNMQLLHQGRRLYGQAVHRLALEICKPEEASLSQQVMLSALAFYYYEMVMNTSDIGWVEHVGGTGKLMEVRGPRRHQFAPDHDYFLYFRRTLIGQAFVTRTRTFLEREEWKTVPWAMQPNSKTTEHLILDVSANVPGLAEDMDRLERNGPVAARNPLGPNEEETLRESLRHKLIDTFGSLLEWRFNWESTYPDVVAETVSMPRSSLVSNLERPRCLDRVFYYNDIKRAEEIQQYHLTMLWVLQLVVRLQDPSVTPSAFSPWPPHRRPDASNALALPHDEMTTLNVAREIARSTENFTQPQHPRRQLLKLLGPLRGCVLVFMLSAQAEQYELSWVSGVLCRIADEFGFDFCKRFAQLPPLGYYQPSQNERVSEGASTYTFADQTTGFRQTFLSQ